MATRHLHDWLTGYLQYTEDTEPARIFQKWSGLFIISSALRKKTHLMLGRLRVYPNVYLVFVAEPGIARKSQSIDFGVDIMSNVPDIQLSADSVTREAILQDLETIAVEDVYPNGESIKHSSLSIVSREFETFLGDKKANNKMVVLLTDLFDCKELPWKYRTKNSGNSVIPSVFLNLLAATTPESLASCLPATAIGGGLTSRILFIWADKKYKKVPRPQNSPAIQKLKEQLSKDLYLISRISGAYDFSTDCAAKWDEWYNAYEELDPNRICTDPSFNGWYSRKPTYILKVALSCAASKSDKLKLEWDHIQESMAHIAEVENSMGRVFRAIGKSAITTEVDAMLQIVKARGYINEKSLMSLLWRDCDALKFDNVAQTAIRTGQVYRSYKHPKTGDAGDVWYVCAIAYPKEKK